MKKVFNIVTSVLLAIAFFLVGFFVLDKYFNTNANDETIKEPLSNGVYFKDELLLDDSNISLNCLKENEFKVEFDAVGYSLRITPKSDFIYTIDGEQHSFLELSELTEFFDIKYFSDSFKIIIDKEFTMQNLLKTIYPDAQEITLVNYSPDGYNFSLTVYSSDYKEFVTANFNILSLSELSIKLDKTEIII